MSSSEDRKDLARLRIMEVLAFQLYESWCDIGWDGQYVVNTDHLADAVNDICLWIESEEHYENFRRGVEERLDAKFDPSMPVSKDYSPYDVPFDWKRDLTGKEDEPF